MRSILLCFFLLSLTPAFAQNMTGIWRGHFRQSISGRFADSLSIEDRYKFETQILQDEKSFNGVTYSYKTTVFYGKASCYGSINTKSKKVLLEENKLLEVKSLGGGACLMTCFLQYSKVGNEEFLEGTYTSISTRDSTNCGHGTVFLRKVENSDFYKETFLDKPEKRNPPLARVPDRPKKPLSSEKKSTVPKDQPKTSESKEPPAIAKKSELPSKPRAAKPAPKKRPAKPTVPKPPGNLAVPRNNNLAKIPEDSLSKMLGKRSPAIDIPRVLTSRKNELVRTITTSSGRVSLKIYDNGTVDNDTVSVYLDNKLLISKQRLTETAIELTLNLDKKNTQHELVMVAENLGEIPPNTSLMIVDTGTQQYEVRITSTEQQNAMVIFKYTP